MPSTGGAAAMCRSGRRERMCRSGRRERMCRSGRRERVRRGPYRPALPPTFGRLRALVILLARNFCFKPRFGKREGRAVAVTTPQGLRAGTRRRPSRSGLDPLQPGALTSSPLCLRAGLQAAPDGAEALSSAKPHPLPNESVIHERVGGYGRDGGRGSDDSTSLNSIQRPTPSRSRRLSLDSHL